MYEDLGIEMNNLPGLYIDKGTGLIAWLCLFLAVEL